jgi:hypothetical protein
LNPKELTEDKEVNFCKLRGETSYRMRKERLRGGEGSRKRGMNFLEKS